VTDRHNQGKTVEIAHRHFRVGVAKGEIVVELERAPSGEVIKHHAGMAIAIAVRLEAAARPGEILICENTYHDLPEDLRADFGQQETVKGKREESFMAHRKAVG
jgi:class 3 adenylate cyclase